MSVRKFSQRGEVSRSITNFDRKKHRNFVVDFKIPFKLKH